MDKIKFEDQRQLLFGWLYDPFTIIDSTVGTTLEIMIHLVEQYGIDKTILIAKIIKYLHQQKFTKQQTIDYLFEKHLLANNYLEKISEIIDNVDPTSKPFNNIILGKICLMAKNYKYQTNETANDVKKMHSNQPLPHPILGRPKLDYLTCLHEDCNKTFNTPDHLITHLQQNNAYTYGFHKWHEESVLHTQLTPEKVINNKKIGRAHV